MNFYQKWWNWFRNQARWLQVTVIIGLSVLLVVGIWVSSFSYEGKSAAETVDSTGWMISVFLKMLLVIMLIIGAAIVAKRWMTVGSTGKVRQMQVLETLNLNPKRALHIVQVGGQTLLIGATDQSITLISELDPAEQTQTFSSAMQQAAKSQEQS